MNTVFALMAAYEAKQAVPLETVHKDYFAHMLFPRFKADVMSGDIPLVTFTGTDSQKAQRMVAITDLAAFLDKRMAQARSDFKKLAG
ncbi:pyocin activator PrtN family protein [Marivivens aquimaris]|uniref:pyocin activator PrtN family protein n=1 Tax=Marivivens aquimaris TaxID=2774876 RepID=UPI0018818AA6|nr:pyocin activator PrtN family protein [Marivivens aquimaris]